MDNIIRAVLGIIVFAIVLFIIGFFYKHILSSNRYIVRKSKYLKSIDKLYLSNGKYIELVQLGDNVLILGITQGEINILKEIKQEDLNELQTERKEIKFSSILEKYIKKKY